MQYVLFLTRELKNKWFEIFTLRLSVYKFKCLQIIFLCIVGMSLLCKNLSLQLIKFCELIEPCSAMCLCKKVWLCLSCMHCISQFSILADYLILLSKQFFTLSEIGFDQFWIFCEIRRWFSLTIRLPKSFLKKSIKVWFLKFSISNKSLPTDKRLLLLLECKITKH